MEGELRPEASDILKKVPEDQLESMVREKQKQFHGLLTKEAALYAISSELGIAPPPKTVSVSEFSKNMKRVAVIGRVKQTFQVFHFEKNGKSGRLCRVLLVDDKGEGTLTLWNNDVDYVEFGTIMKDDLIEIQGAYMKNDELHLGYGGKITVKERLLPKKIPELSDGDVVSLTAHIIEIHGIRKYERDGRMHELNSCTIDDGSGPARLVLWEPNVSVLERAQPGDSVRLEDSRFRNGELHVGQSGKVSISRPPISPDQLTADFEGELEGKLEELKEDKGSIIAKMEGNAMLFLSHKLSLDFLGLKSLPEDIRLETIITLKGRGLLGKKFRVSGKSEARDGSLVFVVDRVFR
ncbi:MAG: hypothetical protein ABIG39_00105 [Candidatus Micrarchaeota archaeon]